MLLESLWRDTRHAARALLRRPLYAAVATLTLALVVGAGSALMAVVDATLLRPLPFPEPGRLVRLYLLPPGNTEVRQRNPLHSLDLVRFRRDLRGVEALEGLWARDRSIGADGDPESVTAALVSPGLFRLLGGRPVIGRTFTEEEDRADARVVVLSHGLWHRRFGADPAVLGRTVSIDREPHEIIGVMGPDFEPAYVQSQLWTPLAIHEGNLPSPRSTFVQNVGRLRPGTTVAQLGAEAAAAMAVLARETPATHAGWTAGAVSLRDAQFGTSRPALLILSAAVVVLALIACANLANLTLAQAMGRRRERALRAALGAGTGDLMRLQALESLLLGAAGAVVGALLAHAALPALLRLDPQMAGTLGAVRIDARVLAASAVLAAAVALVSGLLPLGRELRRDPAGAIGEGTRGGTGTVFEGRLRAALVAVETGLAVVLVAAGAILLSGFANLSRQHPGFDPRGVLGAQLRLPAGAFATDAARSAQVRRVLDRLRETPGVADASTTLNAFLPGLSMVTLVDVEGAAATDGQSHTVQFRRVSPGYFRTMRIPLLEGRDIGDQDVAGAPRVAVVSRLFASRFWPGQSALGRRVQRSGAWHEVVGVVGDASDVGYGQPAEATFYIAYHQQNAAVAPPALVVRAANGDAGSIAPAVRAAVLSVDPAQPLGNVVTVESFLAASLGPQRFRSTLLLAFAGLGLALAVVGIFGVTARGVHERTREVGVRLALGAAPAAVWRLVVGQAMRAVAAGVAAGAALAAAAGLTLMRALPGMEHARSASAVPAVLLLVFTAFVAAAIPALRAARINPTAALRHE
jgi:putative ABC transport system permease protein